MKVSVLVPIYKTERAILRETIESVLNQSFGDFELVMLDDAPGDSREDVVKAFGDVRIRYVKNERNMGISAARNRLLELARGEYLAILDHDDKCRVDRLEKEVAYLDGHPECGVVSSWMRFVPDGVVVEKPVTNEEIRVGLMGGCVVAHSAAMIRAAVLKEHHIQYEAEFSPSEDYRLWMRILEYAEFHTIAEPLLDYRIHEGNTTQAQSKKMWRTAEAVQRAAKEAHPELFEEYVKRGGILPKKRSIVTRWIEKICGKGARG